MVSSCGSTWSTTTSYESRSVAVGPSTSSRRSQCASILSIRPEDSIYGLGEKSGHHNRRGRDFTLWNTDILDPERTKEFIAGRPPDDLRSEHAEVTGNGYEAFARRQFDLVVHGAVGDAVFVDGARLTLDGVS